MTAASSELNDSWNLYFHDPRDADWTRGSYHLVAYLSDTHDVLCNLHLLLPNVSNGMFFAFRESIFPSWDDTHNLKGGCFSIKVPKSDLSHLWRRMCLKLFGETLLKNEHRHLWAHVNGISCSPKRHFAIVKIWVGSEAITSAMLDLGAIRVGDVMYKSNMDNIHGDRQPPPPTRPISGNRRPTASDCTRSICDRCETSPAGR
jgi:hypothetical protein